VPAYILFNKSDLFGPQEKQHFSYWNEMYQAIGYKVLLVSAITGEGMGSLREILCDRTTLMSGHSGVGKSTLINALIPDLTLRTTEVSDWSGKGMHTTTFAEMFDLPFGGSIIDTPGMREFGLVDIGEGELSHYFPEMRNRLQECQFNNCRHLNEPGCAIKLAVENGDINIDRYGSYLSILETL
jgi:ribosome biogenesis GTPase